MNKILRKKFFDRNAIEVAPDLLGKYLARKTKTKITAQKIVEVEAYTGPEDLASHSSKGRTARTEVMFGAPGHFYVYFIYGMYFMLNIVCGPGNHPSAVLIRGLEGIKGPGVLTKSLKIDRSFNGKLVSRSSELWVEDRGEKVKHWQIEKSKRIGVDYAGDYRDREWRFVLNPSLAESKTK